MSGIAAIYDSGGGPVSAQTLLPLLEPIAHRGPQEDMWLGEGVALGQRLLPTTPEAASEGLPIRVAGGNYQLALDGRIDNREDIAVSLGVDLRHEIVTDADLIVYAYDRWGLDCVQHLAGDFAFILWDRRRGHLFAARDQRGFRPLVYTRLGQRLVLGSESRQLLVHDNLPQTVDPLFLACHLTGAAPPQGATPYKRISEVPPAHYLLAKGDTISIHEYWRFEPRPTLRYRRREEYVEHFEATFEKAVASAVRARSAPAVLLSGGLDSSYVLAHAAAIAPGVGAYAAFVEGSQAMDERRYSRAVGERLGVPVQEIAADDCWSLSSHYLADTAFDQPNVPMQAPLMVRMAEAAQQDGVNVLIDGIGGDEFMAGPSEYLALLIVAGRWGQAGAEARAWARRSGLPLMRILRHAALVPLLPTMLRARYRALRGRTPLNAPPPWIDSAALRSEGLEGALHLPAPSSTWKRRDSFREFWSFHTGVALPVLAWRERQALPLGVEARSPFWDLRVVELMLRIPDWVHRSGGQPKALLREAMRPRLPKEVVERDDKGVFDELMNGGLLDHERQRVEVALLSGPLTSLPYVNGLALAMELENYSRYQHPWWHALWRAASAGLWLQAEEMAHGQAMERLVTV